MDPNEYNCARQKFEVLNASIFAEPEKVVHVVMRGCGVQRIEPNAFSAIKNLTSLNLNGNNFSEISTNELKNFEKLSWISLNENRIRSIDFNALRSLKLTYFSLWDNPLEFIDLNLLARMTTLRTLALGSSNGNIVYPDESVENTSLNYLVISGFKQSDGNEVLKNLRVFRKAKHINISVKAFVGGVQISSVRSVFPNLLALTINMCKVKKLNGNFENDECVKPLIS